jgi:hypothetical protein
VQSPLQKLNAVAEEHGLVSTDEQLALMEAALAAGAQNFDKQLGEIDAELTSLRPVEPDGSQSVTDRALARAPLTEMTHLLSDGPTMERLGYDGVRLVIPRAAYETVLDPDQGHLFEDNDIIDGWYYVFADGAIGAIAVRYADAMHGGPFVDAWLILPDGIHTTAPNVSLPPRDTLDKEFTFPYPDGTFKVIKLVTTPQGQ